VIFTPPLEIVLTAPNFRGTSWPPGRAPAPGI